MAHPKETYGTWRLYGDAIERRRDQLRGKVPPTTKELDVHELFLFEALNTGVLSGGRGFDMDKLFRQTVNHDVPEEVKAFENALYLADQLFQSQDLAHAS